MKKKNALIKALILFPILAYLFSACDELFYMPQLRSVKIVPETLILKVDDTVTLTAIPIPGRESVTGLQWSSSDSSVASVSNGTVKAMSEGTATITVTTNEGVTGTCAVTVRKTFEVTFDSNGGSFSSGTEIKIKAGAGDRITEPAEDPTKSNGDVFCGWWDSSSYENRWNFGRDTVTDNITLYARWLSSGTKVYTVTFDSKGGSYVPPVRNVEQGTKISQPADPTKTGRLSVFGGWYKDANASNRWSFSSDTVTDNITLHANWLSVDTTTYTVTFNSNGGSAVDSIRVVPGSTIPKPPDPIKTTGTTTVFAGWYTRSTGGILWDFNSGTVTGDITLYARWADGIPVTFSSVTANGSPTQTTTQLTLTFNKAIDGLSENDITLSGVSGVSKGGPLSGSGPTYTLLINVTDKGGNLTVTVAKSGYAVSGSSKTVQIYRVVTFNGVTADGSPTTTQLTLTFDAAITNLNANDITLSGVSGVSKGTLSGSGPTYTLPISGFTNSGTVSVSVAKIGYSITGSPKTVDIYYAPIPPTSVTFNSVTANGSSSQTTTQLTLTFSAAITGLTANDIALNGVSGISKGTLSGSGPTYTLPISGFTNSGTVSVEVLNNVTGYNITGSPQTAPIYYSAIINDATIAGVTAPSPGKTPVLGITANTQYTGTVTWSPADNEFKAKTVYTATITLTAEADYTFTGVAANFFTVSGATTVNNTAGSGSTCTVTATFPQTDTIIIDGTGSNTLANLPTLTAPYTSDLSTPYTVKFTSAPGQILYIDDTNFKGTGRASGAGIVTIESSVTFNYGIIIQRSNVTLKGVTINITNEGNAPHYLSSAASGDPAAVLISDRYVGAATNPVLDDMDYQNYENTDLTLDKTIKGVVIDGCTITINLPSASRPVNGIVSDIYTAGRTASTGVRIIGTTNKTTVTATRGTNGTAYCYQGGACKLDNVEFTSSTIAAMFVFPYKFDGSIVSISGNTFKGGDVAVRIDVNNWEKGDTSKYELILGSDITTKGFGKEDHDYSDLDNKYKTLIEALFSQITTAKKVRLVDWGIWWSVGQDPSNLGSGKTYFTDTVDYLRNNDNTTTTTP